MGAAASGLTASGPITVSTPGTTIENLDVSGGIEIDASNTTLRNVRITLTDTGSGTAAINIGNNVTGTQLIDCTVSGATANPAPESAIFNHYGGDLMLTRVYLYNFADPIEGPVTVVDSYISSNGTYGSGSDIAHIEDIYASDDTVSVTHSVLFNPWDQTATVFMDTNGGSGGPGDDHLTIAGSLLAGGGWTLYPSAGGTSVGTATMNVTNNRFARCLGTPDYDPNSGGTSCQGGADTNGYWPYGGFYGTVADANCPPTSGQSWSGNTWDDDGSPVCCDGSTSCP